MSCHTAQEKVRCWLENKYVDPLTPRYSVGIGICGYNLQSTMKAFNTLRLRQNGRHFPDDIFKYIWNCMSLFLRVKLTGTGELPSQRPVTRSFDVFFDLRLNKRLSKHSWRRWFETPSCSLRCHCNTFHWRICVCSCLNMLLPFNILRLSTETKSPTFSRRHFQRHFL